MRKQKRILLTGGGSGGHIMPNLAIAENIVGILWGYCGENCGDGSGDCGHKAKRLPTKRSDSPQSEATPHNIDILYVGSRAKLDRGLVEVSGLRFKAIFTGKLRRYFSWRNFVDPFFVILGFLQSVWIIITYWPSVVFCKGGFVSLPVAFAAWIFRRPIVLHESDAVMGLSNRIVSKLASRVCVAFPEVQNLKSPKSEKSKIVFTGNPIRKSILDGDKGKGYQITGFRPERPVVLVWGGSQGAVEINEMVKGAFLRLKNKFQIVHITGHGKMTDVHDEDYVQFKYLGEELKHIYAITDFVVGRSGANSLYELAIMRKPNILIPLQSSAHNHQQLNAEYFEREGASIVLRDQKLDDVLIALYSNEEKVRDMKKNLERIAKPEAGEQIANLLLEMN